ncbi:MAG TPA: hypothetical protein VIK18_24460, partial [Pirellulales bacterium]
DPSALGALINTSATAASYAGIVTLGAASSIGSDYINSVSGITAGGNITLSGQVSGAFALTKVGSNTLNLTGITSASTNGGLTVALGTLEISGASTTTNGAGALAVSAGPFTAQAGTSSQPFSYQTVSTPGGNAGINVLNLDYTGLSGSASRINSHSVTLTGGELLLSIASGPTAITQIESTAGNATTLSSDFNLIKLSTNSTSSIELTTTLTIPLTRSGFGTGLIQGNNFGTATLGTAGDTNIVSTGTFATTFFTGQVAVTSGALNTGIAPWLVVDSSSTGVAGTYSFATYNNNLVITNTIGIAPLASNNYETVSSTNWATLSNITNYNQLVTSTSTAATLAANASGSLQLYAPNSLTIDNTIASGSTPITIGAGNSLMLQSGGVLDYSGNTTTIAGPGYLNATTTTTSLTTNATQLIFQIFNDTNANNPGYGTTTLQVNATVGGAIAPTTGGLVMSGDGTLVLNSTNVNSYTGTTSLNLGKLQFGSSAPANNPIIYPFSVISGIAAFGTATGITTGLLGSPLVVNAGATLDLNGASQTVGQFNSVGTLPGTGGTVTNSNLTKAADLYVMN